MNELRKHRRIPEAGRGMRGLFSVLPRLPRALASTSPFRTSKPDMLRSRTAGRGAIRAMLACLVLAVVASAACSETGMLSCPEGTDPFVKYELYMGRSGQSGEIVDDAAWDTFLGDTVTPRFPDGLTVLDARGQWRDSAGAVAKERSKLLVILVPPGDEVMGLINEVSDEYKRRFSQESVLRVVSDTCVSFS